MTFAVGHSGNPSGQRKVKLFREALLMELKEAGDDRKQLRDIARSLINKASDGDIAAIKEFADRLDGKVPQTNIMQGDEEGGPVRYERVERVVVRPDAANTNSGSVPAVLKTGTV